MEREQQTRNPPRCPESGYAMMLVFLMAAAVAVTLYAALPRVSFEAQRQKEQLLIDRGEQYQRAIELYFRANHRYPNQIEELESSGNHRYLRRRYADPITGKDDWRVIRIGPAGVLVDSAITGSRLADQVLKAKADAAQAPSADPASAAPATAPAMDNSPAGGMPNPPAAPTPDPQAPAAQPTLPAAGGAIAGVAIASDHRTILAYHDRRTYREWEFVFDFTKRRPVQNPLSK